MQQIRLLSNDRRILMVDLAFTSFLIGGAIVEPEFVPCTLDDLHRDYALFAYLALENVPGLNLDDAKEFLLPLELADGRILYGETTGSLHSAHLPGKNKTPKMSTGPGFDLVSWAFRKLKIGESNLSYALYTYMSPGSESLLWDADSNERVAAQERVIGRDMEMLERLREWPEGYAFYRRLGSRYYPEFWR